MKKTPRWLCATLLLCLIPSGLVAGTQLIAHGQDIPEALDGKTKSPTASTILEALFDSYFEKGVIAFDVDLGKSGGWTKEPLKAVADLARKNGVSGTVYYHLYWSPLADTGMTLDKIEYAVYRNQDGKILLNGSLDKFDLKSPDQDEEKQAKAAAERLLAALAPALRSLP